MQWGKRVRGKGGALEQSWGWGGAGATLEQEGVGRTGRQGAGLVSGGPGRGWEGVHGVVSANQFKGLQSDDSFPGQGSVPVPAPSSPVLWNLV